MPRPSRALSALSLLLLASCSGFRQAPLAPSASGLAGLEQRLIRPTATHRAAAPERPVRTWMAPGSSSMKRLLYLSDQSTQSVQVFDFGSGRNVGELGGFKSPYGQCVDKRGDVFLTTESGSVGAVLEYSHGGDTPVRTFVTDGHPIGCSISPVGGDLAVDNGTPSGGSDVEIWRHASGTPLSYANSQDCNEMWPPGYDAAGDLFVETTSANSVCELPQGGSALIAVEFPTPINYPGAVMWDGKYLAFADQAFEAYYTAVYQVSVDASGVLQLAHTTVLSTKGCGADIIQPFVVGMDNTPGNTQQGRTIVGGNLGCDSRSPVWFWRYPKGGGAIGRLHHSPAYVVGQSVSIAK